MQEIGLLMYSSSLDLMSYCSLAKKKRVLASLLEAWIVDILSIFSLNFTYALTVGDALNIYSLSVTIFFLLINPIPFGGTGSSLILIAVRFNLLAFHPFIVPSTFVSIQFMNIYIAPLLVILLFSFPIFAVLMFCCHYY